MKSVARKKIVGLQTNKKGFIPSFSFSFFKNADIYTVKNDGLLTRCLTTQNILQENKSSEINW